MLHHTVPFAGRIVLLGFGSIGQAVLPLLLRHLDVDPSQILIAKPSERATQGARAKGVRYQPVRLTQENHERELGALLSPGDFLINLSVDVSSAAVLRWCQEHDVLYIDSSS